MNNMMWQKNLAFPCLLMTLTMASALVVNLAVLHMEETGEMVSGNGTHISQSIQTTQAH